MAAGSKHLKSKYKMMLLMTQRKRNTQAKILKTQNRAPVKNLNLITMTVTMRRIIQMRNRTKIIKVMSMNAMRKVGQRESLKYSI